MALQSTGTSLDVTQTVRLVTHSQQGNMPVGHALPGYSTIDNAHLQPPVSMAMVSTLVHGSQTISSSHGQTVGTLAVPATSAVERMQPIGHVILQSSKEEQGQREQERRIRREIANSNERRRMQSINAGFKSLKSILPHTDGEKLSKAAILQQTSEYITQLEADKLKLMHQNEKLRRTFAECKCGSAKQRSLADIFDKDEGIGSPAEEDFEDMRRGMIEIRQQLDKERRLRIAYEEQIRNLESQIYPDQSRVQSVKFSSSDERRSSSECSPCPSKPATGLPNTTKLQPCARPLLPSLTPLMLSRNDKPDALPLPQLQEKPETVGSTTVTHCTFGQTTVTSNAVTTQCKVEYSSVNTKPCQAQTENLVTVFSHSTKSNQPLKKRAIEIHHQTMSDSGNDSSTQQPKRKVAKITIDHPANIGTRSFLPPSLPPIPTEPINLPTVQNPLPAALNVKSPLTATAIKIDHPRSTTAAPIMSPPISLPQLKAQSLFSSPPSISQTTQVFPPQYTPQTNTMQQLSVTANGPALVMPTVPNGGGIPIASQRVGLPVLASPPVHAPAKSEAEVYTVVERVPETAAGMSNPVYLTVGGLQPQGTNIAYIQHDGDKLTQMPPTFSYPHYIVTPMSSPGTVLVAAPPSQSAGKVSQVRASEQITMPHISAADKMQRTIVAYQSTPSQAVTVPTPVTQLTFSSANPAQTSYTQPQALLQAPSVPKFQSTQIQNSQAVLCYSQPEITLNQLNAVPNLAPPKSFTQPIVLPIGSSLVHPTGGDSPSYIGPSLQENMLQKQNVFINPAALRCRKSSMSPTDSCSTASGPEEEDQPPTKNPLLDDPDCQAGESIPTIKLSNTKLKELSPVKSSPVHGINVAAYDEVSQNSTPEKQRPPKGLDVLDSPSDGTVSVLSNVAGSPPVMRQIDAIQTRRNLETIVQAIDHLEQQERRNSQDRPETSSLA